MCGEKKCYLLSFPILGIRNLTRALQSSPFQNTGGTLSVTEKEDEGRKTLCLILDGLAFVHYPKLRLKLF